MNIISIFNSFIQQRMTQTAAAVLTLAQVLDDVAEEGQLTLGPGSHTVQIYTASTPDKVFVSLDSGASQVCSAGLDYAAAVVNPEGFTLYATVVSQSVTVTWLVMG